MAPSVSGLLPPDLHDRRVLRATPRQPERASRPQILPQGFVARGCVAASFQERLGSVRRPNLLSTSAVSQPVSQSVRKENKNQKDHQKDQHFAAPNQVQLPVDTLVK